MIKWIVYISLLCFAHYANSQWHHLTGFNSGSNTLSIQDFHFFNANEGLVVCSKSTENPNLLWGYVLKTTDGGINWDTIRIMQDTVPVSLKFTSETVGHMLCKTPQHTEIRTFRTTDSGLNWTAKGLIVNANPPYQDIQFYNDSVGIYSTSGYSTITYNGGVSWSEITANPFGGAPFTNLNEGVFVGVGGALLLYSEDTCQNFHVDTIFWGGSANAVDYNDGNFYVSVDGNQGSSLGYPYFNFGILVNYNKTTKAKTFVHFPEKRTRIIYATEDYLLAGCIDLTAQGEQILKSIDDGKTWWTQEIIESNLIYSLGIQEIQCINDSVCFATDRERIYKTTNGGGPLLEQVGQLVYSTPQEEEEENPDTAFLLYPNPFTNELKIESDQEILTIQITDLNGRLVYSGTHNTKIVTLETVFLSTAVYIITIEKAEETIRRKVVKW